MPSTSHNDTFLSCAELLRTEAQRSDDAQSDLQSTLPLASEHFAGALREVAALEQELTGMLRDYADRGPTQVLETRLQYTADSEHHPDPKNSHDALCRLVAVNREISENLSTAAGNHIPPEVAEQLETLWRDVDNLCRQISRIQVTTMQNT